MKRLLLLRGEPGGGKHTVGQIVAAMLDWEYLWFHDLYREPVADPVKIAVAVLPGLATCLDTGRNLVFTRPCRLKSTVEDVVNLASYCGYTTAVICLTAPRETLVKRVLARQAWDWRVSDEAGLNAYLDNGGAEPYPSETLLDTGSIVPDEVARLIIDSIRMQE